MNVFLWFILLFAGSLFSSPGLPKKQELLIAVIGDSLSAGHGLSRADSYPDLLEKALRKKYSQQNIRVLNLSASGKTSAYAMTVLKRLSRKNQNPDLLLLALGANDGLQNLGLPGLEKRLNKAIAYAQKQGMEVMLAGMQLPSNMGPRHTQQFADIFPRVAKKNSIVLIPFLLEGVAMKEEYNLPDRIHPNKKGQQKILGTVQPFIEAWINAQT